MSHERSRPDIGLGEPDMAYIEHAPGATLLEREADVVRAKLIFDQLRSLALAQAESRELTRRVADEF